MAQKQDWQEVSGDRLQELEPLASPRAVRLEVPRLGYFMTTELCELSCAMCHFNGPNASRRGATTTDPTLVRKVLAGRPKGEKIWFVATGEFFNDPCALDYLREAASLGLSAGVITHGQSLTPPFIDQVLETGLKEILLSVDSIDPDQYARIRQGGHLNVLLNACRYLREQKLRGRDITVGVTTICFPRSRHTRAEVEDFWRDRVDYVQFVSEYRDVFRLRRLFWLPEKRTACPVELIPLPSGHVAPCCAVAIYSHDHDVSWLPHLSQVTPEEAHRSLCDMYEDPGSALAALCSNCDWWVQFHVNEQGNTPIFERVHFEARRSSRPGRS